MKKIVKYVLTLSLLLLASLALNACNSSKADNDKKDLTPKLTLSDSQIKLEIGESRELKYSLENTSEAIIWSVEDESILKVEDGKITGLNIGETKVIAKVEDLIAKCQVIVEAPKEVGTLSVDYENLKLTQDNSITINAKVTYKNANVEDLTYSFEEISTEKILSLSADGEKCIVTATGYGETKIKVTTTHFSVKLEKVINVKVVRDISLEISNLPLTQDGYNLTLQAYVPETMKEEYKNSFTPIIKVMASSEEISNPVYTMSLEENNDVVEIIENKIVAKSVGNTVVMLNYIDENDATITTKINVSVEKIKINLETSIDFDLQKTIANIDKSLFAGEISKVVLGTKEISFAISENNLVLTDYNTTETGEMNLEITTDKVVYTAKACVATMIISTKEDLNKLATVSKVQDKKVWDGYYILANDIDYYDNFQTFCGNEQGGTWGGETGFIGTFDGRGHLIKGFTTSAAFGGLFGTIGSQGIVKNVGFVDAQIKDSADRSGIVASFVYGKILDVFVEVKQNGAWFCGGICEYVYPLAEVSNCVIFITETNERDSNLALTSLSSEGAILNNCYSVGSLELYRNGGDAPVVAAESENLRTFNNYEEFKTANLDLSSFNSEIWNKESNILLFKAYAEYIKQAKDTIAITNDNNVDVTNGFIIEGLNLFTYSIKNEIEGISIINNEVKIEEHFGEEFSIVATFIFDNSITTMKTFKIAQKSLKELNSYMDIDLSKNESIVTIDEILNDTLLSIKMKDNSLSFTQNGNNITISDYKTLLPGESTVYLEGTKANYTMPVVIATKHIYTCDDWKHVLSSKVENKILGYYVLKSDLDYTGIAYDAVSSIAWGSTEGFAGTFDGRGHEIKNLGVGGDGVGFFGTICIGALVKNVAFTNATIIWGGSAGIVSNMVYGTVQNVYVSVSNNGGWWTGAFGGHIREEATISNCVVEILNGTTSDNKSAFAAAIVNPNKITDSIVIAADFTIGYQGDGTPSEEITSTDELKKFTSREELISSNYDFTTWDMSVWDLSSGFPKLLKRA